MYHIKGSTVLDENSSNTVWSWNLFWCWLGMELMHLQG